MSRSAFPSDSCVVADVMPSPNFGDRKDGRRPDMILLHYTGMPDANAALHHLCSAASQVSAHYFVHEDGRVAQMVPESKRAWHAGASSWAGETDINSCSIGIEISNPGHDFIYRDFPKRQIAAVTALCRGILTRNTIPPARVLAHSDVAPARKQDPGEKFPWRTLFDSGVGIWVKPAPISDGPLLALGDRGDTIVSLQQGLGNYGYALSISGHYDSATHEAVTAFQRHFRPERVDGVCDVSTLRTLQDLLAVRSRPRTMAARVINFDPLVVASQRLAS
jgi:N-acetylmuramoyl-L-alanine amidase